MEVSFPIIKSYPINVAQDSNRIFVIWRSAHEVACKGFKDRYLLDRLIHCGTLDNLFPLQILAKLNTNLASCQTKRCNKSSSCLSCSFSSLLSGKRSRTKRAVLITSKKRGFLGRVFRLQYLSKIRVRSLPSSW